MIRKAALAIGLGAALLLGSATTAFAADNPPADTMLTYAPGPTKNEVVMDTNLTAAQRANITEYDIRVNIVGQATRNLTLTKLPGMLFNIIPGTKIHAYLTLKGDFGTSQTYDAGSYTQGEATPSATVAPTTATPSTPDTTPSTPTRVATPTQTYTPPVAISTGPAIITPRTTTQNDFWTILGQHLPLAIIVGALAFIICAIIWIRRRRS